MRLLSSSPAVMPPLCPPFSAEGNVTVATDPAVCAAQNAVPFDRFDETYEPLRCNLPDRVFPGGEDVPRRICTAQGTPLFVEEFEDMARGAEAISVLPSHMYLNLILILTGCSVFLLCCGHPWLPVLSLVSRARSLTWRWIANLEYFHVYADFPAYAAGYHIAPGLYSCYQRTDSTP